VTSVAEVSQLQTPRLTLSFTGLNLVNETLEELETRLAALGFYDLPTTSAAASNDYLESGREPDLNFDLEADDLNFVLEEDLDLGEDDFGPSVGGIVVSAGDTVNGDLSASSDFGVDGEGSMIVADVEGTALSTGHKRKREDEGSTDRKRERRE
jgi:hypothetical protein